jgi:integrase
MAKLRAARENLRKGLRARQTIRGYESDWKIFTAWCHDTGRRALPADSETVSLYATWLVTASGRRCSTAERHIAAIADRHKRSKSTTPDMADAREIIHAMKRESKERPRGKAALTQQDLAKAARACDTHMARGCRDRAMLVLGFATSMRRSELAALDLADISFDRRGLVVVIRSSKTDQVGKGRTLAVWPGEKKATDPVRTMRTWLDKRGEFDGPLFCRVTPGGKIIPSRLTGDTVNDSVKRCLEAAGMDPRPYGAHSLRAGAITTSAELGHTDQEIMSMSGHGSQKVMQMYIRSSRLFAGRNPLAGAL